MQIIKKHPLAIRWFHWVNFPLLTVMLWSGLLIYWANDVYAIRAGTFTFFRFFPPGFYKTLGVANRLAEGMAFHFVFMWIFFLNGLLYVLYTMISGEWRFLLPTSSSFKDAWQVLLHDLHLRTSAPAISGKYNAAQRIAYSCIIVMGCGSVVTGLAIYKPVQFGLVCSLCGGYEAARLEHFVLAIGYCLFFAIHILQVVKTGWNNFQAMITGFETVKQSVKSQTRSPHEQEKNEQQQNPGAQ